LNSTDKGIEQGSRLRDKDSISSIKYMYSFNPIVSNTIDLPSFQRTPVTPPAA